MKQRVCEHQKKIADEKDKPITNINQIKHDEIDRLDILLKKYLPTLKAKKRAMIALHLSDIAGEIPNFEKCYTALVQSEEISEDNLADCMEEMEISIIHMLNHMKDLKPLLKQAVNVLP